MQKIHISFLAFLLCFSLATGALSIVNAEDHPSPLSGENDTSDAAEDSPLEPFDPIEPVNRAIFEFNRVIDGLLLNPIVHIYKEAVPCFVQKRVHNVLTNLSEPVVFLNDILQGKMLRAGESLTRLLINSTFGLLGLFDVAEDMGVPAHSEDFAQTLGTWGVNPGAYLVIPIIGPMDFRGLLGFTADFFVDPFNYYAIHSHKYNLLNARIALYYLDEKKQHLPMLEHLEKDSLDYYAALRSLYWQRMYAKVTKDAVFDDETMVSDNTPSSDHPKPTM